MARETRSKSIQKARKTTGRRKAKTQSQIALEKEYRRLRKNLQQQQRYYRQRGMLVYEDIIPSIPKKITPSSIKRLQNIDVRKRALKGERIPLQKGERFDPTTGEIIGAKPSKEALETLSKIEKQHELQKAIEDNRKQLEQQLEQKRAYAEQKIAESEVRQEYYKRVQNMQLYGTDSEELIALSYAYEEIEVFPKNLSILVTAKLDSLINEHGALKVGHAIMQMGAMPFHEKMQNKAQSYLDNISDYFAEILNHLDLSYNEMEQSMQEIDELEGGYDTEYDY